MIEEGRRLEGLRTDAEPLWDVVPAVIQDASTEGVGPGRAWLTVLILADYVQVAAGFAGKTCNEKSNQIKFVYTPHISNWLGGVYNKFKKKKKKVFEK